MNVATAARGPQAGSRGATARGPVWPVVLLAVSLALGACASNRTPERSFTTREEAAAAGMFDAAGVPAAIVPASAQHLRERRNLATGEIWARYEFGEGDGPEVGGLCQPVADLRLAGSATRGISWWPELLRGDTATARQHFDLFACRDAHGTAALAVHKAMTTAFYWRGQ